MLSEEQMAINRLVCGNTAHSCKADYIKTAIKALEKQVPMKPNGVCCGSCGIAVIQHFDLYCPRCGQRIDWRDSE